MAASSSGNNEMDVATNAMEEGEASGVATVDTSFQEFLRQRQEESLQGRAASTSGGNVEVDESPLKPSINRNKESLKIKLQMRRPITQLVEQGILPSPNTPPAYASQRVKLERARMGDLLKAKIQSRPSRSELVRQHILEETDPRVAPLLAEKQRMLKRARLADSLNDHLIHRPGPLELVKKNILHAPDESIEKAIKDGIVPFKATCEGATPGPPLPTKYICQEDDSSSDVSSPSVNLDSVSAEENAETPPPQPVTDATVPEPVIDLQNKAPPPPVLVVVPTTTIPLQPPPPPPAPPYSFTLPEVQSSQSQQIFAVPFFGNVSHQSLTQPVFQTSQPTNSSGSGSSSSSSSYKCRSKKISKSKSQSKPKTIKFHEYRGPPSAQKSSNMTEQPKRPAESSYELLLQQQQLFLQWQLQLEWQRFPKILLPAVSKMSAEEKKAFCSTLQSSTSTTFPSSAAAVVSHHHHPNNLHPVVDHSLPMQIISNPNNSVLILSSSEPSSTTINTHNQTVYVPNSTTLSQSQPTPTTLVISANAAASAVPQQKTASADKTETDTMTNKTLNVSSKLNDWKVNELKIELKKRNLPVSGSKSQLVERLQASYLKEQDSLANTVDKTAEQKKETTTAVTELKFFITTNNNNSTATLLNPGAIEFLQKSGILKSSDGKDLKIGAEGIPITIQPSSRSMLQQKIQQKMQQQQQLQAKTQLMNMPPTKPVKNEPEAVVAAAPVVQPRMWTPNTPQPSLVLVKTEGVVEPNPNNTPKPCPSGQNQKPSEDPWVLKITETTPSSASFENCLADLLSTSQPSSATAATINQGTSQSQEEDHIKSQMVDDVLEILIRNGELPASAAQDVVAAANQQSSPSSIPPAPPLPPTTFAVTLPTEITFRRLAQPQDYPKEATKLERKRSLLGITSLSKEAQDILKIREDLVTTFDSNPTPKPMQNTSSFTQQIIKKEVVAEELMDLEDNNSNNLDLNKPTKLTNGDSIVIDELLTEALEFPMDLDAQYSDWLESFSSDNTFNNFNHNNLDKVEDSSNSHHQHHHHHHNRDPLLSSTKICNNTSRLDNVTFPIMDQNNVLMDIDHNSGTTTATSTTAENDLLKLRKEDNVVNNHNDLWDFSF